MQLGLRPRLRTRPSLYDLVQKKNIDQISISGAHIATGKDEVEPHQVPLPVSPLLPPQGELPPHAPPHITLQEASDDESDTSTAKMPPVSSISRAASLAAAN